MSFASTSLVVLRESLEAFLILGILTGMVRKIGRPEARRPLWIGAGAGFVLSVVLAGLVHRFAEEAFEENEALFEVGASLAAVAILTYMVIWMQKHTRELMGAFQAKVREAAVGGGFGALFAIAFVAVLREGVETALFLGTEADASGVVLVSAAATGFAVSLGLAMLLFSGLIRLNIRHFFATTGFLLLLFAGWLLFGTLHEMGELGWLPELEVAGALLALAYVAGLGVWYLRPLLRPAPAPVQA